MNTNDLLLLLDMEDSLEDIEAADDYTDYVTLLLMDLEAASEPSAH